MELGKNEGGVRKGSGSTTDGKAAKRFCCGQKRTSKEDGVKQKRRKKNCCRNGNRRTRADRRGKYAVETKGPVKLD